MPRTQYLAEEVKKPKSELEPSSLDALAAPDDEPSAIPAEPSAIPAEVAEELASATPQVRQLFETFFAASYTTKRHHPLFDKFTDQHVDKFLDVVQAEDIREHRLRATDRYFRVFYFVATVSVLLFLVWYLLPVDKALLMDLIKILIAFVGGFGVGYGAGKKKAG